MRLLELDIHAFGCLKNLRLEFPQGMLFLFGPNESGKSTLQAFLLAMFYGFGRGSKDPEKSLRLRFCPWEGAERMGGMLRFELNGTVYRLERHFGKNRSGDSCRLFSEDSGDHLPLKNPDAPGDELFSLSRADFEMLCVLERASEGSYSSGVDARVAGISESGEESLSSEAVRARLRKEERRLQGGSDGGALGRLDEDIRNLALSLREAEAHDQERWEAIERSRRLEAQLDDLQRRLRAYELLRGIHEEEASCSRWEQYLQEKQARRPIRGEKPRLMAVPVRELTRLSGQKRAVDLIREARAEALTLYRERERSCRELSLQQHEHRQRLALALERYESAKSRQNEDKTPLPPAGSSSLPALALSLLPLLVVLVLRLAKLDVQLWMWLGAALLPLAMFCFFMLRDRSLSEKRQTIEKRRLALAANLRQAEERLARERWSGQRLEDDLRRWEGALAQTVADLRNKEAELEKQRRLLLTAMKPWVSEIPGTISPEDLLQQLRDFALSSEEEQEAGNGLSPEKEEAWRQDFERSSARLQKYRQELAALAISGVDEAAEEQVKEEERKTFEALAREKAELDLRLPEGPNPADLERRLRELRNESGRLQKRQRACRKALEILDEAEVRFRREARPVLMASAGSWLSRLSHGRYGEISLDSDHVLRAEAPEDRRYHEDVYYSSGTRDLLWLSLRLAAGDLIFKEGEALPLILDDSLLYLDRERASTALAALRDAAGERSSQVLLLSSSSEELELARSLGIACQSLENRKRRDEKVPENRSE